MKKGFLFLFPTAIILSAWCMNSPAAADQATDFEEVRTIISSGHAPQAQELVEEFLKEYPAGGNAAAALYLLGQLQFQKAAYDNAVETFSRILLEYSGWKHEDRALFGLAMSKISLSDYSSASKALDKLLFLHTQSEIRPEALYWMGEALYRNRKYAAALGKYEEFLELYPDHRLGEHALESAAWCLEQQGKNREAIEKRRQFLLRFSNSRLAETASFCLATDLMKIGNYSAAVEEYSEIAEEKPASDLQRRASSRAVILSAQISKPEESARILEEQASQAYGKERLLAGALLANGYLQMNEYDKARGTLKRLLDETEGNHGRIRAQLALAYMGLGATEEAVVTLLEDGFERKDSSLQEIRALLIVDCLLKLNGSDVAAETLSKLVGPLEPGQQSADVLMILARSFLLAGRYEEAERILALYTKNQEMCRRNPEIYYYHGFCLYQRFNYIAAREQFEKFLKVSNERLSVPARFLMACCLFETGRFKGALELYASVLESEPCGSLFFSAIYRTGLLSIIMRKYESALSSFEQFSAEAHGRPAAAEAEVFAYFSGIAHMRDAHPEKAISIFESLSRNPFHKELADNIIFGYALAEFETGNYEGATRILRYYTAQFADSDIIDAALFLAAASQYEQGAVEEAGAQFEKFADLFSTSEFSSTALVFAGLCEQRLNHPETAIRLYQKAFEGGLTDDDRSAALSAQASAYMATGDVPQALTVLGLLSEEPQSDAAHGYALFWKGRLLYSSARWSEAQDALEKFTSKYPDSPFADDALFLSARAARMAGYYWEAERSLHKLDSLYPNSSLREHAIIQAAECKMEAGETYLAERDFSSFADRNVKSPYRSIALYHMGKILKDSGKLEEALERFRAASNEEADELSARCRMEIASCLEQSGRIDQAISELVRVVSGAYPPGWAERAHLQMARLLEREGQKEEARQVYDAVARSYPLDAAGAAGKLAVERLKNENRIRLN